MLRETFDELNFRGVEWKCDALNARSRNAALRLGFSFEGIFRQHFENARQWPRQCEGFCRQVQGGFFSRQTAMRSTVRLGVPVRL
jgi:RimJ/RimL family protein N-acetyltransferase